MWKSLTRSAANEEMWLRCGVTKMFQHIFGCFALCMKQPASATLCNILLFIITILRYFLCQSCSFLIQEWTHTFHSLIRYTVRVGHCPHVSALLMIVTVCPLPYPVWTYWCDYAWDEERWQTDRTRGGGGREGGENREFISCRWDCTQTCSFAHKVTV